ncbi:hypothetical protein ACFLWT_00690 [Chloroflexota bacterium]
MKKIIIPLLLLLVMLALSGCQSGITQEQYDELQSELTSSNQQLEELNIKVRDLTEANAELENSVNDSATLNKEPFAIAAYSLWYDYYYEIGTYNFNDIATFNAQLGSLIMATGDANSQAAFEVYYQADSAYNTIVDSLPTDNIWIVSQFEDWRNADVAREEAFGQVGGHLFKIIETIPWFKAN